MSNTGELEKTGHGNIPAVCDQQMLQAIAQMAKGINDLAMMLRVTNERMDALEKEVRRLTKVTPAQANALNQAIRNRATELCSKHRADGCEKMISGAIRKNLKLGCGISSVRELPRSDFALAIQRIDMWDDYRQIKEIKAKGATKNG